jgi:ribosomal protein L32
MMTGLFMAGAAQEMARAAQAQSAGQRAGRIAEDARAQTDAVARDVEKLFMITEALWSMLKEQTGHSDEELIGRIQDIDLRDGRLDGKVASQPNPSCPQCGRTLLGKHPVCLYCGTAVIRDPFER